MRKIGEQNTNNRDNIGSKNNKIYSNRSKALLINNDSSFNKSSN